MSISIGFSQTNEERKERANDAFEEERYVDATADFLHLLSLDPLNHELNFKYGTCLLYSSGSKGQAMRYLNYAVESSTIDPRAHYFRGRALHLNFQFSDAEKEYKIYKNLRGKPDERYKVDQQISMCGNGKKLLTNFTDILVANKQEIGEKSFFNIYTDSKTIGGTILVVDRYQTKLDKKMGHVPVVHYPPNADAIYYSSYGDDLSTGLDIYVRRKLPDGKYGDPQLLPGDVNTNEDEDFPFMHASGQFLYFSSTGHNSMGGYDVFMSKKDPESFYFNKPENVDFAISSPNDDLFYVVDEKFENAYFASSRQSEKGKLHVYRVKVVRVPVQDVIVMGDFVSEIDPSLKNISVKLTAQSNGNEIGQIKSNAAGKYSYVFPKGGKYEYDITIEGAQNDYKFVVTLPIVDELKTLKQRIVHKIVDGEETVIIENLFGEDVEGAEALIAQVIRKKSELDVNLDNYNLEEIEAQKKRDAILADLGLSGMSPVEIENRLEELSESAESNNEKKEMILSNLDSEMLAKANRVGELDKIEGDLLKEANKATDPVQKHNLLQQAKQRNEEKQVLINAIAGIKEVKSKTESGINISPEDVSEIMALSEQYTALIEQNKEEDAIALLQNNADALNRVQKGSSYEDLLGEYIKESNEVRKEIQEQKQKELEWERSIEVLQQQISNLEGSIETSKKKDIPDIKAQIVEKQEELLMTQEYRDKQKKKVSDLYSTLNVLETQVASLQNAIETDQMAAIDQNEFDEAINQIEQNSTEVPTDYEELISEVINENPELFNQDGSPNENNATSVSQVDTYVEELNDQWENITNDNSLSENERLEAQKISAQEILNKVNSELEAINDKLSDSPNDAKLKTDRKELAEYKSDLEQIINDLSNDITATNSVVAEKPTKAELIEEVNAEYTSELDAVLSNSSLSQLEKKQTEKELRQEFIADIDSEIASVEEQIRNESSSQLKDRLALLNEVKNEESAKIAQLEQDIEQLTNESQPIASKTKEEYLQSYNSDLASIETNGNYTEEEKIEQLLKSDEELLTELSEVKAALEEKLKTETNNGSVQEELNLVDKLIAETKDAQSKHQQELASLNEVSSNESIVATDVLKDYDENIASIESNESLSEVEKQQRLLNQNEALIEAIDTQLAKVEKKLKKNPADEDLLNEKQELEALKSDAQNQVDERNQTIAALSNQEASTNVTEATVLSELVPDYQEQRENLNQQSKTPKVYAQLIELENEVLAKARLQLQQSTNEEEKSILNDIISEKEQIVSELKNEAVQSMTDEERNELISSLDKSYSKEIKALLSANNSTAAIAREKELQENIRTEIAELEKQQQKSYSVSIDLELLKYEQIIKESENKVEGIQNESTSQESEVIAQLKEEFSIKPADLKSIPDNLSSLKELDQKLANYEEELFLLIEQKREENDIAPSTQLTEEIEDLETELETVKEQRRRFNVRIGELETEIASAQQDQTQEEKELELIQAEETQIKEQLQKSNLTKSERKELESQLASISEEKNEAQKAVLIVQNTKSNQQTEQLITQVKENENVDSQLTDLISSQNDALKEKEAQALKAKSVKEQNYLLEKAQEERVAVNDLAKERIVEASINKVEEQENISVLSKTDLEQRRRKAIVRVGNLQMELKELNEQIDEAKKKDKPALEKQKAILILQIEEEKTHIEKLDARILELGDDNLAVVEEASMEQVISFNEERQIAATEGYEKYEEVASKALDIEDQIRTIDAKLEKQRAILIVQTTNFASDEEISLTAKNIRELTAEKDKLSIELTQARYIAQQALPTNPDDAMKMQNLVARGIKPLKTTVLATALVAMPETGFSIDANGTSNYTDENPIPVGVSHPSGLVYRVQVGAFARPIPQNLFKEFNPVSGEKIDGTNITRYMAGYFNNSSEVVDARGKIRELGYSDAFVVAYCDGERITFGEARRMEANQTCVPKGKTELVLEVAENTAKTLGIETTGPGEVVEVPELSYNKAPGAVEADAVDEYQGLFFTVQIGVFNRPVDEETIFNLPEIMTYRLDNGLIRYMTGMFDSVEDAYPRQTEARRSGVKGAFVTAYYKGERISIGAARKILAEEGEEVLQSRMMEDKVEEPIVEEPEIKSVEQRDTVSVIRVEPIIENETPHERVQIVSKKSYDEFPRDVLNRYNSHGSFYFDESDRKVKSIIYRNEDYLPQVYYFRDDIDTVYIPAGTILEDNSKIVEVVFSDSIIPGDFMDKLLRINYRRSMYTNEQGLIVRLYGIPEEKIEGILNEIRIFGVEPVIREEQEFELELED